MRRWCDSAWLRLLLAAVMVSTTAPRPRAEDPQSAPTSAPKQPDPRETMVDLSDPTVRARLRAKGVDPDELLRLLRQQGIQTTAPAAPTSTQTPTFPPVTPPPGPALAPADSTALPDSLQAQQAQYFGYDIFRLSPKTFEPLAFGPVSPDYLIGPGDEIIVNVWGAQEMFTRAEVNREGYIVVPDLGQVLVNGYTLGSLKEHLQQRLARIYSGIRSDGSGRTMVDVSLGKLRSIQVFVLGDAVQPGGYTMSATSTVMTSLYYAGGPTLKGSMRNVRLMRNNKLLQEVDLYDYLAQGNRLQDTRLENGDVVFVPPVQVRVQLEGEVQHPATYELRAGETLADLLELAGGLKSTALLERAQIERIIPFEQRSPRAQEDRKVLDLSLAGTGRPGESTALINGDIVRIFPIGEILKNMVDLVGTAVYKPGTYECRSGMRIADLIELAGGLLGDAYLGWGHLVRTRSDKTKSIVSFNVGDALKRVPEANLELQGLDQVQVFSLSDISDRHYVRIEGLVRKPGKYDFYEGITVTDLIFRAGGLRESAYRMQAEVSRIDPEEISEGKTATTIRVAMSDTLAHASEATSFKLEKNDIVFIREIPNWGLQENVWVTGEVRFPGMYTLTSKGERLSSVIQRAGGLEKNTAYLRGANFIRKKDETGRMALDFEEALKQRKKGFGKFDIVMVAGDSIHIPREPKTVKVEGAVGFPSSVLWEEGRDLDYYLEQAGGLLDTADKGRIRVIMANGRVHASGFFSSPEPDQGARVIVPTKPEKKDSDSLKTFAEIITILTGAATTAYLIAQTTR